MSTLLEVKDLSLEFKTERGTLKALNGISFDVRTREIFGLVGETGCGKTVTGLSILRLLPRSARITNGEIIFWDKNLLSVPDKEMEVIRGGDIAMIFQDPSSSPNPVFTIGSQMERVLRQHKGMNSKAANERAAQMLNAVGLPDVKRMLAAYPHQLSGGQQQRVMIAMALSCEPRLLIADEPTTALDVTIQAQILRLLRELQTQFDFSVILITHNLGVVAQTCDRLAVLYAGRVAEIGSTNDIFNDPQHPYTRGLMNAIPKPGSRGKKMQAISGTVEVHSLKKHFRLPGGWLSGDIKHVYAVDGVDLTIASGETFGLVGESGCGKTTLGRMILRLIEPTSGKILFDGKDITAVSKQNMKPIRREMQIVFQNPLSSLSPRLKVEQIVAEPLITHNVLSKDEIRPRVIELLKQVGLGEQHLDRFPHEMSGGQCQRVAVARALALNPKLIVLDEPTSALDVSVQAQIINLLDELKQSLGLTYLFISHDLNVVQHISDRIGVMYLGKLVEVGSAEEIYNQPLHPYTQALFGAIPMPVVGDKRELKVLEGNVPSPVNPPSGCRFHTRCPIAQKTCQETEPVLSEVRTGTSSSLSTGHFVACHFVEST
jgi:oligopeptide/dipeptide ABC transporter ATP-binding protein